MRRAPLARVALAWLPLALAALVTLPLLGARDLWAPDEPRYAEVAQEMLADGHWWYPHVNGRPYADKPPLYFWLAAAAGSISGHVTEGAARLPSAVAHLLLVLLTAHLGRRIAGPIAGAVAASALATTWLAAWMARRACLDVVLTLCVVAAVVAAIAAGDSARRGRRGRALALAAGAGFATGLGFMTKGPVVLVALASAGFPILLHPATRTTRPPGFAPRALLAGGLALALTLAAWLVPARILGGYDPLTVMQEHVIDRATEGKHHAQPPWYFAGQAPADFMPWTLLAVPALAWAWRRRTEWPEAMLLGWSVAPLLVHSVIVEKRNIYALPVAPAWALACGAWVAAQGEASTRGLRRAVGLAAAVLAALGLLAVGATGLPVRLPEDAIEALELPGARASIGAVGVLALLGAAGLVAELRRAVPPARLALGLALAFAAVEAGLFYGLARFDPLKSGRSMGAAIRRETGNQPLAMFPVTKDAYVYYSGRTFRDLGDPDGARQWLARAARPAYVLVHEADRDRLPMDGGSPPRTVFSDAVGHRVVLLLRYDQPPEAR